MKKCILFSRVSTINQDLTQQTDEIKREAFNLGYVEDEIVIIEYKESGIKLDLEERLGIQKLFDVINENNNVECVIIYEISRISRRAANLYQIRDFLIQRNIQLICLKPYFRLLEDGKLSQTSSILFSLFSSISESEMMIKKERMMRGRIARREAGYYIGGNILFGYKLDKEDKIVIDVNAAEVVREIFELYIDGYSIRSIAKDFIDKGKLPYDSYSTAQVMLRRMIKRSEYAGIKNKSYNYPAIISIDVYNKTRKKAFSKNKYKHRTKGIYFVQTLIHDKKTGNRLSPGNKVNQYRIWRENTNAGYCINLDFVDSLAFYTIKKWYESLKDKRQQDMILNLKKRLLENHDKTILGREKLKKLNGKIEKINERVIDGKMSDKQGDKMIEETKKEIKNLKTEMVRFDIEESQINMQLRNISNFSELNIDAMTDAEIQKFIIKHCANVIIEPIYENGKMTKNRNIEFIMKDEVKYFYKMIKRGNYFSVYDEKENEITDFKMLGRYKRKM